MTRNVLATKFGDVGDMGEVRKCGRWDLCGDVLGGSADLLRRSSEEL